MTPEKVSLEAQESYNLIIELIDEISKEIANFKSLSMVKPIDINRQYYDTLKSHNEQIIQMEQVAKKELDLLNTSLSFLEAKVSLGASAAVIEKKKKVTKLRNSAERYWQILHENKRRYQRLIQQAKRIIESEEANENGETDR